MSDGPVGVCPHHAADARGFFVLDAHVIALRFPWLDDGWSAKRLCLACGAVYCGLYLDGERPMVWPVMPPDPRRLQRCICRHLEVEHTPSQPQRLPPAPPPVVTLIRRCVVYGCKCSPFEPSGYVGPYPGLAKVLDADPVFLLDGPEQIVMLGHLPTWSDGWWDELLAFDQALTHRRLIDRRKAVIGEMTDASRGFPDALIPRLP